MKQLNKVTTNLLIKFLDLLKDADELDIFLTDHPILRINQGGKVSTEEGTGFVIGIGTLHDKIKRIYEQKMEFIIIDHRHEPEGYEQLLAYPIGFQDDVNGISEESCRIKNNHVVHFSLPFQRAHANLAYQWLLQLVTAGYLD